MGRSTTRNGVTVMGTTINTGRVITAYRRVQHHFIIIIITSSTTSSIDKCITECLLFNIYIYMVKVIYFFLISCYMLYIYIYITSYIIYIYINKYNNNNERVAPGVLHRSSRKAERKDPISRHKFTYIYIYGIYIARYIWQRVVDRE